MRILFLGDRPLVREVCQNNHYTKVIVTPKGCNKKELLKKIAKEDFDMLVSNGCPWILPITMQKSNQTWVNIHPSMLPDFKGANPIKEMQDAKEPWIAASCHFIDEGMDTGNIIHQERLPINPEMITLDNRYKLSFAMEAIVFTVALDRLSKYGKKV